MPVPSSPAAGAYTEIIARTISARFNTRHTLRSATASLLKDELLEKYPLLDFDPTRTLLAQPQPEGGWRLTLLLDVVLAYLANGVSPVLNEQFGRACFLTNTAPVHLSTGRHEPDMQVIAEIILEMPSLVFVGFQEALRDYWDEPVDAGVSRWQWLGDLLNGVLKASAVRRSSTHTLHADILTELTRYPDQQQRLEAPGANGVIHAFVVETTLRKDQRSVTLQSPDLLVSCGETLLLCSVAGDIESFPSLEAFGRVWGARFEQAFVADAITWKRYEPDGNLFDTQAALLLNQQLEDLAALKLPAGQPLKVLENATRRSPMWRRGSWGPKRHPTRCFSSTSRPAFPSGCKRPALLIAWPTASRFWRSPASSNKPLAAPSRLASTTCTPSPEKRCTRRCWQTSPRPPATTPTNWS